MAHGHDAKHMARAASPSAPNFAWGGVFFNTFRASPSLAFCWGEGIFYVFRSCCYLTPSCCTHGIYGKKNRSNPRFVNLDPNINCCNPDRVPNHPNLHLIFKKRCRKLGELEARRPAVITIPLHGSQYVWMSVYPAATAFWYAVTKFGFTSPPLVQAES